MKKTNFSVLTLEEIATSTKISKHCKDQVSNRADAFEYLNKPFTQVLTTSTIKTAKGAKLFGAVQAILYLSPADLVSSRTLCAGAVIGGCKGPCLYTSGQLGFKASQWAQVKRTLFFVLRRAEFMARLSYEISLLKSKHGDALSVRLNGTSDVSWQELITSFPKVQFYDYTKVPNRFEEETNNYDITWSASNYSNASRKLTGRMVEQGRRIAVPINTKSTKSDAYFDLRGAEDFDKHDLRFNEPKGIVGTLTAKDTNQSERDALENSNNSSFFYTSNAFYNLMSFIKGRSVQAYIDAL